MRVRLGVLVLAVALASMAVFSQGCASIWAGGPAKVQITSEPSGAAFSVYNKRHDLVASGTTPEQVRLKKGAGYFSPQKYTVEFTKPGYRSYTIPTENGICGWYWGNFFIGGILGFFIIDPLTGAMWTIDDVYGTLEAAPHSQATESPMEIMTIDQVPAELRSRLVRIN